MRLLLAFAWSLGLMVTLDGCSDRSQVSSSESAQEPHRPGPGPWFEGWYARVTDEAGGRSMAVIMASHRPIGTGSDAARLSPGYIGVLYSEGGGGPTRSWSFFPTETSTRVNGRIVRSDPDLLAAADQPFVWQAEGYGTFRNDQVHLAVPGEVELDLQFGPGKPWDQDGLPLGPEGYLAPLPVPLHWFVSSLRSPTSYQLKTYDKNGVVTIVSGHGQAHLEKNWGEVFPKSWNWLQGLSGGDDAQLVLGGGQVSFGAFDLTAWLGGYRSPKEQWDLRFSDPGTQISVDQEPCRGLFHFNAERPDLEVDITAHAPPATFGAVAVPTARGFVRDFGAESFSSRLEVRTYRRGIFGKALTDTHVFTNGALEFGAGSYCKP